MFYCNVVLNVNQMHINKIKSFLFAIMLNLIPKYFSNSFQ